MKNISRISLSLLCFFAVSLAPFNLAAFAQERDNVLVKTEPPLTQSMVNRVIDFFEWSLGVRLSAEQKSEFQQSLINSWKRNDKTEIEGALQVLKLHSGLSALSDQQLSEMRGRVGDEVLKSLRQEPDDKIALMLISLYESSRSNSNPAGKTNNVNQTNPAPVKVGPGDLYGIYIATTKQLVAPVDNAPPGSLTSGNEMIKRGITWQPGREWITFLPGGRVYAGLPEEGLENFDYAGAVRKHPESKGTYEIKGNVIRVTWADGGEKILKRTSDGELWEESKNYTPLPKGNGLKLDGKYAVLWNEGSARNFMRFTRDGKFEESGLLQFIGWKSLATPQERAVAEIRSGSGTYSISNNTLELRYFDGRVARINFYVFEEEQKKARPEVIYINSFDFRLTQ